MNLKGLRVNNRVNLRSVAANPLILDTLTAAAAYSFRKLRTAYSGSAIEVRRSSDNAVANIGFSGGVLDTTALLAHTGGGNGFITKWYDQSGNGLNATIPVGSTTQQPQIVASGAVILQGSKPTATYSNAHRLVTAIQTTLASGSSSSTMNVVVRRSVSNANMNILGYGANNSTLIRGMGSATSGQLQFLTFGAGNDLITTTTSIGTTNAYIQTGLFTANLITGFTNGSATNPATKSITTMATTNSRALVIGGIPGSNADGSNPTNLWQGNIQEVILFNSALNSTDRGTLESNQTSYYGIA